MKTLIGRSGWMPVCLMLTLGLGTPAGRCIAAIPQFKIENPQFGGLYESLGMSVAVDGDTIVIGGSDAQVYVRTAVGSWRLEASLLALDSTTYDQFGRSVAISGDTVVVGAPGNDHAGGFSGAAYVFVRSGSTWIQEARLVAADAEASDFFGGSVAISGNTILVGAPLDDNAEPNSGSAYVFTRSAGLWTQENKLIVEDGAAGDTFGNSVAISSDTAIIGAHFEDGSGVNSGAAYVFLHSGTVWTLQQTLTASDADGYDQFGESVAIWGDAVVVGASGNDDVAANSGSAYVFVRNGSAWTESAKLSAPDPRGSAWFGQSVAIGETAVVVGAWGDNGQDIDSGAAYVYADAGGTWGMEAMLIDAEGEAGDELGRSVAISGDTVVVGAPEDARSEFVSGSAGVYVRSDSTWLLESKLVATDPAIENLFGWSVAVSGDRALIGAWGDWSAGNSSGAAFVYKRRGWNWILEEKLTPSESFKDNAFGWSVAISGMTAVVTANTYSPQTGAVGSAYVFEREGSTWIEEVKLTSEEIDVDDSFGRSVAISEDTVLVGAPYYDEEGLAIGAAFVFVRDQPGTWTQQAVLTADDGDWGDKFGWSVAISGDTAVVGAYEAQGRESKSGAAYVYVRNGSSWSQQQKLISSTAEAYDSFGVSVGISEDTIIVGTPGDYNNLEAVGSVAVFTRNNGFWTEGETLAAADTAPNDSFGEYVALVGDRMVVGASQDDDTTTNSGSAYVFRKDGSGAWIQEAKLTAADPSEQAGFGWSVALDGSQVMAGAPFKNDPENDSGAAYVFEPDPEQALAQRIKDLILGRSEDAEGLDLNSDGSVDSADLIFLLGS